MIRIQSRILDACLIRLKGIEDEKKTEALRKELREANLKVMSEVR